MTYDPQQPGQHGEPHQYQQQPQYQQQYQQYPAQYQQPAYPAPPHAYGYPPPSSGANGLGVAGFVCGLLGLVFCWIPFVGAILAVLGIVLGGAGMAQARRTNNSSGLGIAGLVLGIIALIPAAILTVAVVHG
jgi:hypothetical protein